MTADSENAERYDGEGLKGPLYWLAGTGSALALKALSGPGGGLLGNLFGGPPPGGPGAPVTREVLDLTTENQGLKSKLYANELNAAQAVWNAKQEAEIKCINDKVAMLFGMTKLTIPNSNLNPGVGPVQVVPVPAPQPPDVATLAAAIAAQLAATQKAAGQGGGS